MGITVSGGNITINGGSLSLTQNIVRDNLLFWLDPTTYGGSGTTWYDRSGNGNNATISGATFVNNGNGSYFEFSGGTSVTADYIESIDLSSYNRCTIDIWFWEDNARLGTSSDRDLLTYNSIGASYTMNDAASPYFRTDVNGVNKTKFSDVGIANAITSTTWYRFCYLSNIVATIPPTLWINETEYTSYTGADNAFSTLKFGHTRSDVDFGLEGRIGNILVYDGALSDAQVQQNYNALSGRYV